MFFFLKLMILTTGTLVKPQKGVLGRCEVFLHLAVPDLVFGLIKSILSKSSSISMIWISFSIAEKRNTLGKSSSIESILPIAAFLMNKKPFQMEDNFKNFS